MLIINFFLRLPVYLLSHPVYNQPPASCQQSQSRVFKPLSLCYSLLDSSIFPVSQAMLYVLFTLFQTHVSGFMQNLHYADPKFLSAFWLCFNHTRTGHFYALVSKQLRKVAFYEVKWETLLTFLVILFITSGDISHNFFSFNF